MAEPKRLLLVDDDDANVLTLGALLEDEGYEVVEALTFARAEELLRQKPFDVVLLDRSLGDRDGAELAPLAKAVNGAAIVCIVSGIVSDEPLPFVDAQIQKGEAVEDLLRCIDAS